MEASGAGLGAQPRRAAPVSLAQLLATKRSAAPAPVRNLESFEQPPLAYAYSSYSQAFDPPAAPVAPDVGPRRSPFVNDYAALHRRLAEQRERLRHESATVIQRGFRQYQHRCYVRQFQMYAPQHLHSGFAVQSIAHYGFFQDEQPHHNYFEEEEELPSESAMIPVAVLPPARIATPPSDISAPSPPSSPIHTSYFQETDIPVAPLLLPPPPPIVISSDRLPEYLVDVQLLSARGLLGDSTVQFGGIAELQMDLCSGDGSSIVSCNVRQTLPPLLTSGAPVAESVIAENCSLQHGDKDNGAILEPHRVVEEWSIRLISKVQGARGPQVQGVLSVPLSLLETGLASNYALCRWFPLEKANPGELTRGDLRLSIRFLQRDQDEEGKEVMVPYVAPKKVDIVLPKSKRVTGAGKRGGRRLKTHTPARNAAKMTIKPVLRSNKFQEQTLTPTSEENLVHIPRAEAISPPSSPSSTSSIEMDAPPPPRRASISAKMKSESRALVGSDVGLVPKASSFKSPHRRVSLSRRMSRLHDEDTRTSSSPTRIGGSGDEDEEDDGKPKKPFLKRKPYKVVFQKLDWSSVPSKTDSRLAAINSGTPTNISQIHQPQRDSRRLRSTVKGALSLPSEEQSQSTGASIDPITTQRLLQLETALHACCGVTENTISEAHVKYQAERQAFEAARDQRVKTIHEKLPEGNLDNSVEYTISNIENLWQQLATDEKGELYSARLGSLLGWNTSVGNANGSIVQSSKLEQRQE